MKKNILIFILLLAIILASGIIIFLFLEESRLAINPIEHLSVADSQTEIEAVNDKFLEAETIVPEKTAGIVKTPELEKIGAPSEINASAEEKNKAAMIISGVKYEAAVKPGSSVYEMMDLLKMENKINFSGKNYSGLGFFIEEINGLKNKPAGENWLYYVNGQPAQVGVSYYVIKTGDMIEWKYEKKSF